MRPFDLLQATTLDEAAACLRSGEAAALAGGGDLLGALKDNIYPAYPKTVVSLRSIPGLDAIRLEGGALCLGAMATLADIARNDLVARYAPLLARAAGQAASPALREAATIGGNLCQQPRCWYYRKLNNRFFCARKGGEGCFAPGGDNRYHAIFGGEAFQTSSGTEKVCFAVNQGELAPVLLALDGECVTTLRRIPIEGFFAVRELSATVLEPGELLTEVRIPLEDAPRAARYKRFSFRKTIDFPVLNLALAAFEDGRWRICLGGVAPVPRRAFAAEALLRGQSVNATLAEEAGAAAAEGAKPLSGNAYKVQLIKALVKRELLAMQ